jgi:signal transduction histidine kinase/ActR/RegA family two-component response regulator
MKALSEMIINMKNAILRGLKSLKSMGRRRAQLERANAEQAGQALLKTGALQDAIFNSANFSSIATDAKGVIQIFNVGAERMLGYSAADVVDKITPAGISDAQEIITRAAALTAELGTPIAPGFDALVFKATRGIEDIYELTYIRKDGSRFPAIVSVTALRDATDKVIGYLLIGTDNTARKQVEAEQALLDQRLRENNVELAAAKTAAEKANLAKSEFLSSMSHELRTPLNAVLGFAQLMASANPPPTEVQKLSIDQILQAGWYLLRLINEILDLALIESRQVSISLESMSLSEVLQDCQAMIGPQAENRGLQMTFPTFDSVLYVHADRTRLKQVMINLLSNAIKYNSEGGSVVVECTVLKNRVKGEDRVNIRVKDSGIGLNQEQLAQLFQPFNRLGQETGSEEGTGIGLVVTKQLVELMGGSISVESHVGIGSMFSVELTLASAPTLLQDHSKHAEISGPALPQGLSSKRTVLYVEDNPANLILVEQLIARRDDLTLITAIDAHLGIKLARAHQPDVILMDINLPGLSGYGALKILHDDPLTTHIPVMALSANAVPSDIEKGLEAGFFRYLTKPIKVNEFMDALDVALLHAAENGMESKAVL